MKSKKELKKEEATQDTKSIESRIIEKRKKLEEINVTLEVWMLKEMTPLQKAQVVELQDRLFFRTQLAEEALLDDKIDLYSRALKILKNG